jgi:hypothetical protein
MCVDAAQALPFGSACAVLFCRATAEYHHKIRTWNKIRGNVGDGTSLALFDDQVKPLFKILLSSGHRAPKREELHETVAQGVESSPLQKLMALTW